MRVYRLLVNLALWGHQMTPCFPTFVDPSQSSVVHLVRTVEDHYILPKTATHVFGGLRLT